jgi:hypothetical protein
MQKLVCIGFSGLTMLIAVAFRDVLINNTSVSIVVFEALHSKSIPALLTFNRSTYIYVVTLLSVACIELINCTKHTPHSKKYFLCISYITIFLISMLCTNVKWFSQLYLLLLEYLAAEKLKLDTTLCVNIDALKAILPSLKLALFVNAVYVLSIRLSKYLNYSHIYFNNIIFKTIEIY